MRRRLAAPVTALVVGIAMVLGGLEGVGSPAGAATTSYQLTFATTSGGPVLVRWAPCIRGVDGPQVIRYKVHAAGRPGRVDMAKRAVRRLHRATGLHFRYAGRTSYIPQAVPLTRRLRAREMERRTGVPFVVAWARQGAVAGGSTLLDKTEAGVGSIVWRYSALSDLRISDAAVVMRRGHTGLRAGFGRGGTTGTLLLHELGHAAGLLHVYDGSQVMNPVIGGSSPGTYADGDRRGLHRVGADAGCMNGPWLPA
ncbi:MAG TPA: hypothetical protein VFJ98_04100 [Mycobacteriales bacterium]|nr:hypothetical protein [Mycobacteriales bacterium]